MRKYYLVVLLAILSTSLFGQVTLDGATIYLSTGSIFTVNDSVLLLNEAYLENNGSYQSRDLVIDDGVFTNNADASSQVRDTVYVRDSVDNDGTFFGGKIRVGNAGYINNTDTLAIDFGLRTEAASSIIITDNGTLAFVGTETNKTLEISNLVGGLETQNLIFNASNANRIIILDNSLRVSGTSVFARGRVRYDNPATDSLVILAGGTVLQDTNGRGIMTDALYRYPAVSGEFMRFPVGDLAGNYRPFWIKGANYPGPGNPKIAVEYLGARTVQDTNAIGLATTYNQNSWGFNILEDSLSPSIIQVQYDDGEADTVESVVAEGFVVVAGDTNFYNLGQGPNSTTIATGGGVVESEIPAQGNSVIIIGQSTELKLRMRAILEGASIGGIFMADDYYDSLVLQPRFEFGGTSSQPMVKNKPVPVGAVDSIMLILRDGVNGPFVDTASAWLMTDGTIRDYITGDSSYAIFSNATAGNYHVIIQHRNHLRVQSQAAIALSNIPSIEYDFRQAGNIRGGGGIKSVGGGFFAIAGGNSNQDNEVNANDYFEVGIDQSTLERGYLNTDVLFSTGNSDEVNNNDFTVVQNNSNVLYFSTVP